MPAYDPTQIERHEKSTWESKAEFCAETAGFLSALNGSAELAVEFGEIDKSSHVLDLGCGPAQIDR